MGVQLSHTLFAWVLSKRVSGNYRVLSATLLLSITKPLQPADRSALHSAACSFSISPLRNWTLHIQRLQLFRLLFGNQGVDEGLNVAVQNAFQIVQG